MIKPIDVSGDIQDWCPVPKNGKEVGMNLDMDDFGNWLLVEVFSARQIANAIKEQDPAAIRLYDEALLIWCRYRHGDSSYSRICQENDLIDAIFNAWEKTPLMLGPQHSYIYGPGNFRGTGSLMPEKDHIAASLLKQEIDPERERILAQALFDIIEKERSKPSNPVPS